MRGGVGGERVGVVEEEVAEVEGVGGWFVDCDWAERRGVVSLGFGGFEEGWWRTYRRSGLEVVDVEGLKVVGGREPEVAIGLSVAMFDLFLS